MNTSPLENSTPPWTHCVTIKTKEGRECDHFFNTASEQEALAIMEFCDSARADGDTISVVVNLPEYRVDTPPEFGAITEEEPLYVAHPIIQNGKEVIVFGSPVLGIFGWAATPAHATHVMQALNFYAKELARVGAIVDAAMKNKH